MPDSTQRSGKYSVFAAVLVATVLALLLGPYLYAGEDYLGYALRVTAWITFVFFILAYVARPLRQLFGGPTFLARNRRYLGLAAALSHSVHFGYVLTFAGRTENQVELSTWILGGLAFVLFWLMALSSNQSAQRMLGQWWRRLHLFGMHYIWLVFAFTFSGGLGTSWVSTLFFIDALVALGLRIAAAMRIRRTKVTA